MYGVFLLAALWVTSRIWVDPAGRVASLYSSDPAQVQFFLAHSVRVVLHGEFPFYTDQFNYPDGVNLMANTAILALGIPMVPVTLLFGPAVSFVVAGHARPRRHRLRLVLRALPARRADPAGRRRRRLVLRVLAGDALARQLAPEHHQPVPAAVHRLAGAGADPLPPAGPRRR